MKSLREYSLNITEKEYHALPYWSHSMIARYARDGFSSLATIHEHEEPTPSMEFGSLFDSIITKGIDETLKEYVIYDRAVPPGEAKVLDQMYKITRKKSFGECSFGDVMKAADDVAYQPKYKPETKYDKIKVYADYYDTMASGKKVISSKDWQDATDMTIALRTNPYAGNLFKIEDEDGIEYLYQLKFVFEKTLDSGEVVKIKFMPDLLVVNHKKKTIQPVDLKTSSMPAYDWWVKNFLKYRYDIQAAEYAEGIEAIKNQIPGYEDYVVLPYIFTDISRSDMQPVSYVYDQTDMSQAYGLSFESNGKVYNYKRWDKILEEIRYYEEIQAKVPVNIAIDKPNNILDLLRHEQ